jgi:Ion channel
LAVAVVTFTCTVFVHVLPIGATVSIARREKRLGQAGASFWSDFVIVALIILLAMVAHLIEIALWAAVFMLCGEFHEFGIAYYHSAVNYTTLGYGDLIMSPEWRLLGPLEAANGILMFGVSTAMIFTLILRLTQDRFVDLRG